jgi:hypothetical protein
MKYLIPIIILAASMMAYSIHIQTPAEYSYRYPLLMEGGYWEPCGAGECE